LAKSTPKIICAAHMWQFLSEKTESTNGMATLHNFETLLRFIVTFFTFEAKLQFE
jgi:hypothetical protein